MTRHLTVDDLTWPPPVSADHRLSYGTDQEQFGDLYLPQRPGLHPVVVALHGGCWQARYKLDHIGKLCSALRNEGIAVWSMEYRRLGNGGGWPGTFQDVAGGMEFLKGIADRFSLDLSRVVTCGHSAGGHLALWLAGRRRSTGEGPLFSPDALPVCGVVSLAGIPDLKEGVKRDICDGACQALVGGLPDQVPHRYLQASPVDLLPLGVPQWHLVGLDDDLVPADYIQQYVRAAGKVDETHLDLLPDVGHYELIVPTSPAWPAVRRSVLTLLH